MITCGVLQMHASNNNEPPINDEEYKGGSWSTAAVLLYRTSLDKDVGNVHVHPHYSPLASLFRGCIYV